MQYLKKKDKIKRTKFGKNELTRKCQRTILQDTRIRRGLLGKKTSKEFVRIKNRCVFTLRGHSVLRKFRASRIKFRELASSGQLKGVRKSSW